MFMISEWFFGLIKRIHCVECVNKKMSVVQSEDIRKEIMLNPNIKNKTLYLKFPSVLPCTIRLWKSRFLRKEDDKSEYGN